MTESVPATWVRLLSGVPDVGDREQAFQLLTVGRDGHPHTCLLSRAELATEKAAIRAFITSNTARENLVSTGKATLVGVAGTEVHACDLVVQNLHETDGAIALRLAIVAHSERGLGIELQPISFVVPYDLPDRERWASARAALELIAIESPELGDGP